MVIFMYADSTCSDKDRLAHFCWILQLFGEKKQSGSPVTDHQRSFEGKTRVSFSGESTGGWSKVEGHQVASQGSSGGKGWRARCNHLHHGHWASAHRQHGGHHTAVCGVQCETVWGHQWCTPAGAPSDGHHLIYGHPVTHKQSLLEHSKMQVGKNVFKYCQCITNHQTPFNSHVGNLQIMSFMIKPSRHENEIFHYFCNYFFNSFLS